VVGKRLEMMIFQMLYSLEMLVSVALRKVKISALFLESVKRNESRMQKTDECQKIG
jgi:hypothetical protein